LSANTAPSSPRPTGRHWMTCCLAFPRQLTLAGPIDYTP
jgi:hypothetical protein